MSGIRRFSPPGYIDDGAQGSIYLLAHSALMGDEQ
jgi:hypothetical protein